MFEKWTTFSRLTLRNVSRWITAEGRDTCKNHFANLTGGKDIGAIADQSSVTTYQTRQVKSQLKKLLLGAPYAKVIWL